VAVMNWKKVIGIQITFVLKVVDEVLWKKKRPKS